MDIVTALYSNYLPYAKSVIIDRSVVRIDGLKPSQRRIMYSMWEAGLVYGHIGQTEYIIRKVKEEAGLERSFMTRRTV